MVKEVRKGSFVEAVLEWKRPKPNMEKLDFKTQQMTFDSNPNL